MSTQSATIDRTTIDRTTIDRTTIDRTTIDRTTIDRTIHTSANGSTRSDVECRARASQFLTDLIGAPPDDLVWDDTHCLQGHGHLAGHELVVIAPRDDHHETVVVTPEDWDAIRRSSGAQRRQLLDTSIIRDRSRLMSLLFDRSWSNADLTFAA